ncbi:acid phosphatase precursor [Periconia macrospinosa]|uniref:Acid phosphatase n=1 Tax=Periconia macrospinosa TaxID=97972 RepID=A0A2V1E4L6_9PLEO|nr:acid phosphatase precursor [Periconia macrospinosa]
MRSFILLGAVLPFAQAIRIIQANDDGWAEANARTLFNSLSAAGHDIVLSAPAENQSGTGSSDAAPKQVDADGCEFSSCPGGSPPTGANSSDPRLNYVNSFPVTSMKNGIDVTGPNLWNGAKPELAVSGPNVGSNVGPTGLISGTVGAASYAAHTAKIPAIAFSGRSGDPTAWDAPTPLHSKVYADLALNLTTTLINSGAPYLPDDVFLNVNFAAVSDSSCNDASQFKFIFTRVNTGLLSAPDTEWCGSTRLPWEVDVIYLRGGCHVSVSAGDANDKSTTEAAKQKVVSDKLKSLLTCL